jgi:multidrug efflux pump subunit AcrA (membrane-fusion protein)
MRFEAQARCCRHVRSTAMRAVRIAGAVLALGALVAACSDDREPGAETTPTASDQPTTSASPSTPPPATVTAAGAGGLTIRYLDADGKIKTLRVEDFPH